MLQPIFVFVGSILVPAAGLFLTPFGFGPAECAAAGAALALIAFTTAEYRGAPALARPTASAPARIHVDASPRVRRHTGAWATRRCTRAERLLAA